jgi:hypothetical protein
MNYKQDN